MVTIYDPNAKLRGIQNLVSLTIFYAFLFLIIQYVAVIITILLNDGHLAIIGLYKKTIAQGLIKGLLWHVNMIYKFVSYKVNYIWVNRHFYKNTRYLYEVLKSLSSFIVVNGFTTFSIIKNWEKISEFRIYKKDSSVHGDAHWASQKEIKKAGLRSKKGMIMGEDNKGFLIADGYQHSLLFAPTGSGKGVGFVIPNMLFWQESVFCHDIKLENYELSSGWRRDYLKQDVFVWSPADSDGISHCYNPVDWISKKPGKMVDDVQKLGNLLLQKKDFWENEARTLFTGVMLYLLADDRRRKSFGEVVRLLRSDDFKYNMAVVLDTMGDLLHPVSFMNLASFLQKPDKEAGSVLSTLNSGLELWANPVIDTLTSRSDFNIQEFKRKKTTVFVGLTPDNIQRLKCLMSIFYQQATEFLSLRLPQKDEPYGVLFLMDEFPTLGKMEQFLSGIAYFRGYHVRLFLVVQDTQQLKGAYEDSGMNSFLSNSTYRITFAANNIETAKLISDLIGNQTVESTSTNRPKFFDLNPQNKSISISQSQRALLLPQEVIGLSKEEQIVLVEASPPIRTKKIFYFKHKLFKKRVWDKVPIPKQEIIVGERIGKMSLPEENADDDDGIDDISDVADTDNGTKTVEAISE